MDKKRDRDVRGKKEAFRFCAKLCLLKFLEAVDSKQRHSPKSQPSPPMGLSTIMFLLYVFHHLALQTTVYILENCTTKYLGCWKPTPSEYGCAFC